MDGCPFMQVSCNACPPNAVCADNPPMVQYSCAQQRAFGACSQPWMTANAWCAATCGRCGAAAAGELHWQSRRPWLFFIITKDATVVDATAAALHAVYNALRTCMPDLTSGKVQNRV